MEFFKIEPAKYFSISLVSFNNWNRIFERCIHMLKTDLNLPYSEDVASSLLHFLKIVYPTNSINCRSSMSQHEEIKLAESFIASILSYLIDVE
jgi:hypothetical protein